MLELLEMIFGTADSLDSIFSGDKTNIKHEIPIWLRIIFFIFIFGSALLVGIAGGFSELEKSHIIIAVAYWAFAFCLVVLLIYIIYKVIKLKKKTKNK